MLREEANLSAVMSKYDKKFKVKQPDREKSFVQKPPGGFLNNLRSLLSRDAAEKGGNDNAAPTKPVKSTGEA